MREAERDRKRAQRTVASCHAPHTKMPLEIQDSRTYGPILRIPRTYTCKLASKGQGSRCTGRAKKSGHKLSCIAHIFTETGLDHIHAPERIRTATGIQLLPGVFQAAGLPRPRSEL